MREVQLRLGLGAALPLKFPFFSLPRPAVLPKPTKASSASAGCRFFRLPRPAVLPRPAKARKGEHHQHQPAVVFSGPRCSQNPPRPAKFFPTPKTHQGPPRRASSASAGCCLFRLPKPAVLARQGEHHQHQPAVVFSGCPAPQCSQNPPRPAKASIISISRLLFFHASQARGAPKTHQGPPRRASSASVGCRFFRLPRPAVLPQPTKARKGKHHQHQPAVVFSGFTGPQCSQNPPRPAKASIISISQLSFSQASQARGAPKTHQGPPRRASSASAGCRFSGFPGPQCSHHPPRPAKASISRPAVVFQASQARGAPTTHQGPQRRASPASAGWRFFRLPRPAVLPKPTKARKGKHHQHQPAVVFSGPRCSQNPPRPAKFFPTPKTHQGPPRRASSASAGCCLFRLPRPAVLPQPTKARKGASASCRFSGISGPRCSQNPPRPAKASIISISRLSFFQASQARGAPTTHQGPQRRASSASAGCRFFRLHRPAVLPKPTKARQGEHHQHQPAVVFCRLPRPAKAGISVWGSRGCEIFWGLGLWPKTIPKPSRR